MSAPSDNSAAERATSFQTGLSAERRACLYLNAKGYRILARRYRTPHGEIDVVAKRRATLVFAEVKARGTLDDAAYSVTPANSSASPPPPRYGLPRIPTMQIWIADST